MNAISLGCALCALSSLAGAARADSGVTVYGIVDLAVEVGRYNAGVNQARIQSGDIIPSRLGLRGSEELGGGLKANFGLEMGINADTGVVSTDGTLWTRGAFVGIEGGAGRLDVGRHFPSLFWIYLNSDASSVPVATSDVNATLQHSAALGKSGTAGFFNNTIRYRTPAWRGIESEWSYSFGNELTGARANDARNIGMNVQYRSGALWSGYGFNQYTGRGALDAADSKQSTHMAGATYNFGPIALGLNFLRSENLSTTHGDADSWALTAALPCGAGAFNVGTGRLSETGGKAAQAFSLGYVLTLSKRTQLYSYLNHIANNAVGTRGFALMNASYATVAAGFDPSTVTAGLRMNF
ncbi:MAG: porin [Pseudomonadota bacterium]